MGNSTSFTSYYACSFYIFVSLKANILQNKVTRVFVIYFSNIVFIKCNLKMVQNKRYNVCYLVFSVVRSCTGVILCILFLLVIPVKVLSTPQKQMCIRDRCNSHRHAIVLSLSLNYLVNKFSFPISIIFVYYDNPFCFLLSFIP